MGITPEQDFQFLLKSRHHAFWIVTGEEPRVERALAEQARRCVTLVDVAGEEKKTPYRTVGWDVARGAADLVTGEAVGDSDAMQSPLGVFDEIRKAEKPSLWVLRDLDRFLGEPVAERALKSLVLDLQGQRDVGKLQAVAILTPAGEVPLGLRSLFSVLDWPLPTRETLDNVVGEFLAANPGASMAQPRSAIVDALAGLSSQDAGDAIAYSAVSARKLDAAVISGRKRAIIGRERILTWYEPDPRGLDGIGGLGLLKAWLIEQQAALTPEARAYGLPAPKGVFLTGPPGCGKSLTCKAVATAWGGLPLLQLDMGALKGGLVGQSEANIRRALRTAEAVAPCVLWLDEIEKGLAGAVGGGLDSGVSADQLGYLLNWLQEHSGAVFVVATSNDPLALPPELTRKGRFDEVFFVDLPGTEDRANVLLAALRRNKRPPLTFAAPGLDVIALSRATEGFSGAEIAELVPAAMRKAFLAGARPLRTADLLEAARTTVPVSRSASERITALRQWAKSRARFAAEPEKTIAAPGATGRALGVGSTEETPC